MIHIPVLTKEILDYLDPKPNQNFIDATLGFAGHTKAILEKTEPNGRVLGIELDNQTAEMVKNENIDRLVVENGNYVDIKKIVENHNFNSVQGILFDLGMSSWHLEGSNKGFSFRKNQPLDMRFNDKAKLTAKEVVNKWPSDKIQEIIKEFGEERFAKSIAKRIAEHRQKQKIETTFQLVEIIKKAVPVKFQHSKTHFATRTFQALRIAVNQELENIKQALPSAVSILEKQGKIAVISFHSLEDRIVKHFFRQEKEKGRIKILTKKPITASQAEIEINPRARSAKLRIAEKI